MFFFDPKYFLFVGPALLLALWAQMRMKMAYAAAQQLPAPLSGAAAARHILDSAGLNDVAIEEVPGELTDHYDPREKVLRLSTPVYNSRTLAAVGIAAARVWACFAGRQGVCTAGNPQCGRAGRQFRQRRRHLDDYPGSDVAPFPPAHHDRDRTVCRHRLFSTGESAGRVRRQQSGESPACAIGHHRRRRTHARGAAC